MTIIAGVFALFAVICYLLCFSLVRERVEVPQNTSKLNLGAMIKNTFTNRALLGIIAAAIMLLLGQLGMTGMAPYVFPVYYNSASAQSLSSMTGSIAMLVICAPFAGKLAAKFGKKELSIASCIFGAAAWLVCLVVRPESANVFVLFYTLAMIGIGFFNTVIWAMITDVIDDAEVKNGVREDGTIYALYSFARKLGQALSAGMIGSVLTAIGYNQTVAADPAAYPEVINQIFNWSCLIPAVGLILVALALLLIYPLSKKKVEENVAALAARR
jgi:GPH family glycoside/pentoside/hexuronide:cation symporter